MNNSSLQEFPVPGVWNQSWNNNGSSEDENHTSSSGDGLSGNTSVFVGLLALVYFFIGTIGNGVTIASLLYSSSLRGKVNTWFVLNLCTCDLLFCLFRFPIAAVRHFDGTQAGSGGTCRTLAFVIYIIAFSSRISMVGITVNRYVLIVHYSWYKKLYYGGSVMFQIGLSWLIPTLLMLGPLFTAWGKFDWDRNRRVCWILENNGKSPEVFLNISFFVVPCSVIIFCYSRIFSHVRKHGRLMLALRGGSSPSPVPGHQQQGSLAQLHRGDWQLTKTILLIFCSFFITFFPPIIITLSRTENPLLITLAELLLWTSFPTNFLIYAVTNRGYRKAYEELLCRQRRSSAK